MCGIGGYIGKSKDLLLTHEITTNMFKNLERRGTDAAGLWGTVFNENKVYYQKEPIRSSLFIEGDFWKNTKNVDFDLLLLHARATSVGVGWAINNKNNHPFVSSSFDLALVHNGRIPEHQFLRNKFNTTTDCDSEILLRIFEATDDKIESIKNIWSMIYQGHMAVAIGKRNEENRELFLFRNKYRSLWIVDLIDILGQIFFVSTPDIWFDSVKSNIKNKAKLVELQPENLLHFQFDSNQILYKKYLIKIDEKLHKINDEEPVPIANNPCKLEVVTNLKNDDEIDFSGEKLQEENELAESVTNIHQTIYKILDRKEKVNIQLINTNLKYIKSKLHETLELLE